MKSEQFEALIEAMLMFENNIDKLQYRLFLEKETSQRNALIFMIQRNKQHWTTLSEMLESEKPL